MRHGDLSETLLELHYYPAFREVMAAHFGRSVVRILKPTQNEEAHLGFDQGFVQTTATSEEIRAHLKHAIASPSRAPTPMFAAYFLQYKCPERLVRKSKAMPNGFQVPYYRFELSLEPNKTTGISQHETLLRLQSLPNSDANYICPMITSEDRLWEPPNLDDLVVVPLASAPGGYATKERHFVAWQDPLRVDLYWCSEPSPAKALRAREWVSAPTLLTAAETLEWIREVTLVLDRSRDFFHGKRVLPASLTILEFGPPLG
jgi:hypothetical protein